MLFITKKKQNENKDLHSEEYEKLSKRIVGLVSEVDITTNKLALCVSDIRKLRLELRKQQKEEEIENESVKNNGKLYL